MVTAQKAEYMIRKYLEASPKPNHTMDNGIHAMGGMGLKISKIGRNNAETGLNQPIRIPRTMPAEMVRSQEGVGWVIIKGQDSNSTVQILVGIVAIGIVGYILAVSMRAIEARLCRWSVRGK